MRIRHVFSILELDVGELGEGCVVADDGLEVVRDEARRSGSVSTIVFVKRHFGALQTFRVNTHRH